VGWKDLSRLELGHKVEDPAALAALVRVLAIA
jgi:hypothetical protein